MSIKNYSRKTKEQKTIVEFVTFDLIEQDYEDVQPRVQLNRLTVEDYKRSILRGVKLPPGKSVFDGEKHHLYDGFHTAKANEELGKKGMELEWISGTIEDAIKLALTMNHRHGLRLTREDKEKMVNRASKLFPELSISGIAKKCHVSEEFVGKVLPEKKEKDDCLDINGKPRNTRKSKEGLKAWHERKKLKKAQQPKSTSTNGKPKADLPDNKPDLPFIDRNNSPPIRTKSGQVEQAVLQIKQLLDHIVKVAGSLTHAGRLAKSVMGRTEVQSLFKDIEEFCIYS